jgi:hypothetical protein
MSQLCFLSSMTSSEWAAWVQAVGSIAAVFGAAGIAIWQAARQHKNGLALLRTERRLGRMELAKALLALSQNCLRLLDHLAAQFPNRQSVYDIAAGKVHVDFNELAVAEGAVHDIPLHSLPHRLVSLTMMVRSTVRQFRENIEFALRAHRTMDSEAFEKLFTVLTEMRASLKLTCGDIESEVKEVRE